MSTATVEESLDRLLTALRRRLVIARVTRVLSFALLATAAVVAGLVALDLAAPLPAAARSAFRWLPAMALGVVVAATSWRLPRLTRQRLAHLVDERVGLTGLASTLLTLEGEGPVGQAFRSRAALRIAPLDAAVVAPRAGSRLSIATATLSILAAVLVIGAGGQDYLSDRWWSLAESQSAAASSNTVSGSLGGSAAAPLTVGEIRLVVRPPSYSGLPDASFTGLGTVTALPGSSIEVVGSGTGRPPALSLVVVGGDSLTARGDRGGWEADWMVGRYDRGLEISLRGADQLLDRRVVPLRLLRDRPPEVDLQSPAQDLVLATSTGRIPIEALAVDDFGVEQLTLHWVLSRGSGESFDFDDGVWAWDSVAPDGNGLRGVRSLDLAELALEPGDVLHIRATTADGNAVTGPGIGVSATRQLRISREEDLSDVTTLVGFPIEREREPLLSQRMIILLTEELLAGASGLEAEALRTAAADIADEQARLRGRIGEQIFSRATGASQDPEAHLDFEEGEPQVFLDELEAAAAQGPVIDPETGIATIANVDIAAHEHDSDPIVAINRTLLMVYNLMWDAERLLRPARLDASLGPQHTALEELQRLRESERVFARGRVAVSPIDVPGTRGTGDVDDAAPTPRSGAAGSGRVDEEVASVLQRLVAGDSTSVGRAAAIEISGLALDLLEAGSDPAVAEALSGASVAAAEGDAVATRSGLARAAQLLRRSIAEARPSPYRGPTSLAGARYRTPQTQESSPTTFGAVGGEPRRASGPPAPPGSGDPFVFATVRYASGDWDSAPLVPTNLIHSLAQYTDVPVAPEGVTVDLSSPEIFDYPFLYLTGHLPVFFSEAESRNLVDFVDRGGFIFIDDHNHDIDGAFHRSVTAELGRLFGEGRLTDVPNDHEIYSSFFVFDEGPPITGHELSGWGDGLIHRSLQGVESGGRLGVLYSNKDYSSEWSYHADNKRFLAIDNTRFGVNILVYALTR